MDAAAKKRVLAAMREAAEVQLTAMRENQDDQHAAAEIDQDASFSVDDISQSDEAGDLARLAGEGVAKAERSLAAIEALDPAPTDTVRPGAILVLDGDHLVVGVVAAEFDCDGQTYQGISADAPILAALAGLHAGDTFTFRERQHHIEEIW